MLVKHRHPSDNVDALLFQRVLNRLFHGRELDLSSSIIVLDRSHVYFRIIDQVIHQNFWPNNFLVVKGRILLRFIERILSLDGGIQSVVIVFNVAQDLWFQELTEFILYQLLLKSSINYVVISSYQTVLPQKRVDDFSVYLFHVYDVLD